MGEQEVLKLQQTIQIFETHIQTLRLWNGRFLWGDITPITDEIERQIQMKRDVEDRRSPEAAVEKHVEKLHTSAVHQEVGNDDEKAEDSKAATTSSDVSNSKRRRLLERLARAEASF